MTALDDKTSVRCIYRSVTRSGKAMRSIFHLLWLSTLLALIYYVAWKEQSKQLATNNNLVTSLGINSVSQGLKEERNSTKLRHLSPEERQIARKQLLKEYCLSHTFDKSPTPEDLHMLAVDDKQKFIYCVISKVGTTTWKKVLARPRRDNPRINRWIMWNRLTNYTEEERSKRLKTYFKFMFVREPLHRMVSAYKNKFIKIPSYTADIRKEIVKALRPEDYNPKGKNFVSFPEFIRYFSDNKTRNQHWRQYEKICHPCVIDYDFIGHYETLEEDAPLLLKMAGINAKFPPIHKSTRSSQVLQFYSKIPTEIITRIGELYRSDFEMFGYEFLGPIKKLLNKEETSQRNEN